MAAALDYTAQATVIVDDLANIVYANKVFSRKLGWSVAELDGKTILDVLRSEDAQKLKTLLSAMPESLSQNNFPTVVRTGILNKKHQFVDVKLSAASFKWEEKTYACITIDLASLDMLELRLAKEQAAEALKASVNKTRFLAQMSHEIRAPLNNVLGMIDLLGLSQLDPKQRDYVFTLKNNSRQLRALIEDVLDLSKIEAGMVETDHVPFKLTELLNTAIQANSRASIERRVVVKHECDLTSDSWIGDPKSLGQIISNLISNAVKFTANGCVTVSVTCPPTITLDDVSRLTFTVTDTGIGMSADQIACIFEEYQQGNASIGHNYGGTGLGLFIAKELVTLMGGQLSVRSQPGKGSSFEFSLDLKRSFSNESFQDTAPPVGLVELTGARVLIVEDDWANQKLLQAWLAFAGVETICCDNGKVALDLLAKEERFDAVLMDVSMPVMDGLTATTNIRRPNSAESLERQDYLSNLPIIGISGHAFSEDLARCKSAGMGFSLTKPLSRIEVLKTLVMAIHA